MMLRTGISGSLKSPTSSQELLPVRIIHGHKPHGVLDFIWEKWEDGPSQSNVNKRSVKTGLCTVPPRKSIHLLQKVALKSIDFGG